ncbi:MAG: hypothetical protein HRU75_08590 [Planctomycetia bacterium]|nr:MAG: hypothetical protein HRU75_08590 [Planctomycetia bacterium]
MTQNDLRRMFSARAVRRSPWRAAAETFCLLCIAVLAVTPLAASSAPARRAAIIPIHGVIDTILAHTVERRLEDARRDGINVIIFEMNTPGGGVVPAVNICRMIKNLPKDTLTVAWVRPEALSAGAMISVACQKIYMSRASSIGDSAPIIALPTGPVELGPTERAKAESPVLQEYRDSASANGYDPLLCRAMVTLGESVWWVEKGVERRFVNDDEKKKLIDDVAEADRAWSLVTHFVDPISGARRELQQPIDGPTTLLTLSQSEAVAFGLASGLASNESELTEALNLAWEPKRLDVSGWETFVIWLNSPFVRGVLMAIALAGGYIEFNNPGLLVPGIVAFVALAVFVGAPYAAGLADAWTLVALVIGLLLLLIEVFVLPGFGIAGVTGLVLVGASLIGTFIPRTPGDPPFSLPDPNLLWNALQTGVLVMSSSTVAAGIGILFLMRFAPHLPGARRLVLATPSASMTPAALSSDRGAHVGDIGVLVTPLRPGGQARFGQRIVEVQGQGSFVDSGARVQVVAVEGSIVYVRPVEELV